MALIALLGGSTIGAFGGLLGWLFFDLSFVTAFGLYLACGLCLPAALIAITALRSGREAETGTAYAEDGEAIVA